MTDVPITFGSGQASVATERVGNRDFQIIKVVGGETGSTSVWGINPDRSAQVSVVGTVQVTGSIVTVGSSSVSGAVTVAGSVLLGSSNASVITVSQSSSIIGVVTGSIVALQGTNPWVNTNVGSVIGVSQGSIAAVIIGGSIAATFTPPANQSVSGTVGASVIGNVNTTITSIATALGTLPIASGNVVTVADNTTAGITEIVSPGGNQIGINVQPFPMVFNGSNWDRARGNSSIGTLVSTGSSSVIALIQGSIATVGVAVANQSVSGTVGASVIGLTPVSVSNFPTNQNVSGSVVGFQGTNPWIVTSSIAGGIFPISGSVAAVITGTPNVNTAGSVVAFQGTSPWIETFSNSSIIAVPVGSVITVLQSSSVITTWKDSSILSVPVGSTIAVLQAASIVGTYAEDSAHTSGDKGLFALNVRNDTLASITSADGDYSPFAMGPMGEGITANAPITKWVQGTADLRGAATTGASAIAIAAGGTSVFTYITGVQVVNLGSASVLVTLASGGSTLGYTIAPAGGGSNIVYSNALKTPANFGFAASISGIASVLVSAQGFISKT